MLVHTLRRVVAWALGLVLLAVTASALGVALFPVVSGGSALAVLSGSMEPGLPVGAMAFVRPVDPATVQPGDVITFQRQPDAPELVTHRVVAVDDSSGAPVLTTKGDANDDPDIDPVTAAAVRGELWFGVPHLGRLSAILHSPKGAGLLVVMICAVVAASPGPRPGTAKAGANANGSARTDPEPTPAPDPAAHDLVDADNARTVVMPVVDAEAVQSEVEHPLSARPPAARPAIPPLPRPVAR